MITIIRRISGNKNITTKTKIKGNKVTEITCQIMLEEIKMLQIRIKIIMPNQNKGRTLSFRLINFSLFVASMDITLINVYLSLSCFDLRT